MKKDASKKIGKNEISRWLQMPLLIYILLPSTKSGFASLTTWSDQSSYVTAYDQWEQTHQSGFLESQWLGPGFFALMRLLVLPFSSIQVALIIASFLGLLLSVWILTNIARQIPNSNIITGFLLVFVLMTHLQVFKDLPWTHFWIIPMLLAAIQMLYFSKPSFFKYGCSGFLLAFAWQIRNFESLAVIIAIVLVEIFILCYQFSQGLNGIRLVIRSSLATFFGGIVGFLSTGILSFHFKIYKQYGAFDGSSHLVAPIDLNPTHMYERFFQLFFAPKFNSLSSYVETFQLPISKQILVQSSDLTPFFGQTLVRQQPLLLPMAIGSIYLMVLCLYRYLNKDIEVKRLKSSLILGLSGLFIMIGYIAQPLIGSANLIYGISREFLLPQFLFGMLIISSYEAKFIWSRITIPITLILGLVFFLLPQPSKATYSDYSFVLSENCGSGELCSSEIKAVNNENQWVTLPIQDVYVADSCASIVQYHHGKSNQFMIMPCSEEHFVAILPSTFGLSDTPQAHQALKSKWTKLR